MQLIKYIRPQEKPREPKLDVHMILLRERTEEGDIKMNLAKLSTLAGIGLFNNVSLVYAPSCLQRS